MPAQTATSNRQLTLQLVRDATAVPLAPNVILQDFAQASTVTGREAVAAFLHDFFHHAFAEMTLEINTLLTDIKRRPCLYLWRGDK